jgi:hypothetical protein
MKRQVHDAKLTESNIKGEWEASKFDAGVKVGPHIDPLFIKGALSVHDQVRNVPLKPCRFILFTNIPYKPKLLFC